jgi:serine/threonine protein kinase
VLREYYGEAKISFEIGSDPYAISVEDILEMPDGLRALVCPFIRGHTLRGLVRDHIRRGWLFPFELSAFIFHRVLSVLLHARERDIVHRDLCLNNIMVQRIGVPLVLDWGAGMEHDECMIVGKPGYMAPEFFKQHVVVARDGLFKADIFSLGAVIREMLIGYNDLEADDPASHDYDPDRTFAFREKLVTDRLPPVTAVCPDVPKHLSDIVYTCMKENPAARLDAEQLYDYLGTHYLYTPQVGFGLTAETLKDYLTFFYEKHDPAQPLPESRLGRSLEKVIVSKIRRKAEQPEYRDWPLRQIARQEGVALTLGTVGRTFTEAFGRDRVDQARAHLDAGLAAEEANLRLFDLLAAQTRVTAAQS